MKFSRKIRTRFRIKLDNSIINNNENIKYLNNNPINIKYTFSNVLNEEDNEINDSYNIKEEIKENKIYV